MTAAGRDSGLTVAVTRVGRGGGRPGWLVAAWLAGLAALAAVALVAPLTGRAPDAPEGRAIAVPSAVPAASDWYATRPNVVLSSPDGTTRVVAGELAVVGRLGSAADTVVVSIRTRREHLIDTDRVVTSVDGFGFEASVTVPGPARAGDTSRVWLEVIGYTNDGVPVAGTVAVLRVHAPPPPRLLGDDGGMGPLGAGDAAPGGG